MNNDKMMSTPEAITGEFRRLVHLATTDRRGALERLRRGVGWLRARWLFRGCEIGKRVNALSHVRVLAEGRVRLGDRVHFWEGMIPQEIVCGPDAELSIDTYSFFNWGVSIRAAVSVRIGAHCMFGSMVHVHDSNGERTAPIVIGDDVWVAHGAIIEPGVTIGQGSVISAGSVVMNDVPPWSLAVGNPAKATPLPTEERAAR